MSETPAANRPVGTSTPPSNSAWLTQLQQAYAQALEEQANAWNEYYQTEAEKRSFTGVTDRVKIAEARVKSIASSINAAMPKQKEPKTVEIDGRLIEVPPYDPDAQSVYTDAAIAGIAPPPPRRGEVIYEDPNAAATYDRQRRRDEAAIAASNRSGQPSAAEWARVELERQKAGQPSVSFKGRSIIKIDPWTGEATIAEQQLPQEEITPYQQAVLAGDAATLANSKLTTQLNNEAAMERERLSSATSLSNYIAQATQNAGEWAMNPDWGGVPPGWEAQGPVAQLARMSGAKYTPRVMPQRQFDPLEAWRLARGATGVK